MTIAELIKILQKAPDFNREIYVESLANGYTTEIEYSLDDNNDILLYEVAKIEIPIPILPNRDFDLETQKEIAEKYQKIEDIKKALVLEMEKIKEINIEY